MSLLRLYLPGRALALAGAVGGLLSPALALGASSTVHAAARGGSITAQAGARGGSITAQAGARGGSITAHAAARNPYGRVPNISIKVRPHQVLFGHSVTVSGTLKRGSRG
ncbi:MAG TPA: hypothetical protein VGN69_09380, partial [Solirubrobacteraceae bacterium]|nr:hypothetical protein [Solirubrobacteraceae bacterium]